MNTKVIVAIVGVPLALFILLAAIGRGQSYEESAEARIDRECSQKIPVWRDADGKRIIAGSDAMQFHTCVLNGLMRDIDETRRKQATAADQRGR